MARLGANHLPPQYIQLSTVCRQPSPAVCTLQVHDGLSSRKFLYPLGIDTEW